MMESLIHAGLLHEIPMEFGENAGPRTAMYLVGLDTSYDTVDPVELLVAWAPHGVICYFTALQLHSLTTQVPSHHHIARLTTIESSRQAKGRAGDLASEETEKPHFDPLGTLQFRYDGLPYYLTTRDRRLIRGTEGRHLSDRTLFRLTTLEQTMVDTLHRPLSCGGPAVVLEAWATGLPRVSQARMHEHLIEIADDRLSRRVGYLLEANQFHTEGPLDGLLKRVKEGARSMPIVPLLPGMPYSHVDTTWQLTTP
jgi:predicted transcriptional regulator of viral defense system